MHSIICPIPYRYGITAGYRRSWTLWDALRECVYQEFLDHHPRQRPHRRRGPRRPHQPAQPHAPGAARCPGAPGPGPLGVGASDKQQVHRGRFGKGTKLGWLVLLREQVPFTLTSGDFHGFHACWADLYGEQVMEVC